MNAMSGFGGSAISDAGSAMSSYRDDRDLLTDKNRYVAVASDYLDPDRTFLLTMKGAEELGRDFCYTVDIMLEDVFTDFTKSVGRPATVAIKLFDKTTRYYNGIVEEILFTGMFDHRQLQYRLKLVSSLTLMKYRKNCRIFQNKTSRQIVETLFNEYKIDADFGGVRGNLPQREFCVQFDETDFDFISRLLEQDGIWYYFEHYKNKHKIILQNQCKTNDCTPTEIETNQNAGDIGPLALDNFSDWREAARLTSTRARLKDYNHMDAGVSLDAMALVPVVKTGGYAKSGALKAAGLVDTGAAMKVPPIPDTTELGPNPALRQDYEYPGRFTSPEDGEFYAKIRAEREGSRAYGVEIKGTARQIRVGDTFKAQNPFSVTNYDLQPRIATRWRAVRIAVKLLGEKQLFKLGKESRPFFYKCKVEAITAETTFRPQLLTKRPYIRGPQTAVVEGNPSSIHVDGPLDRVKVKFFWDLERNPKFQNSCWIRVAQTMAGSGFGALVIPRDGHEVVVHFIDGNPDWPIITGAVYNSDNKAPEVLEPTSARSIFRTHTIRGSSSDYNELRFDDTPESEEVYLRAQRNHSVEVNKIQSVKVGESRSVETQVNDSLVSKAGEITVTAEVGPITIRSASKIKLVVADMTSITLSPEGISMNAPLINTNAGGYQVDGGEMNVNIGNIDVVSEAFELAAEECVYPPPGM